MPDQERPRFKVFTNPDPTPNLGDNTLCFLGRGECPTTCRGYAVSKAISASGPKKIDESSREIIKEGGSRLEYYSQLCERRSQIPRLVE